MNHCGGFCCNPHSSIIFANRCCHENLIIFSLILMKLPLGTKLVLGPDLGESASRFPCVLPFREILVFLVIIVGPYKGPNWSPSSEAGGLGQGLQKHYRGTIHSSPNHIFHGLDAASSSAFVEAFLPPKCLENCLPSYVALVVTTKMHFRFLFQVLDRN